MMKVKIGGAKKSDKVELGSSFELVRKINEYAKERSSLLAQSAW